MMSMKKLPKLINLEFKEDARGIFYELLSDSICNNLDFSRISQVNFSISKKGVIRGMHSQYGIHSQAKIIRCVSGSIFDLCIKRENDKPDFNEIHTFNLSAEQNQALYIPENFFHGFQALVENTVVCYGVNRAYDFSSEITFSPLSPLIKDLWPLNSAILSKKDQNSIEIEI